MQDSSALSRPLETMTWAYQQICAGADPWTGLGSFSHAWYGYAKGRRAALVSNPYSQKISEIIAKRALALALLILFVRSSERMYNLLRQCQTASPISCLLD